MARAVERVCRVRYAERFEHDTSFQTILPDQSLCVCLRCGGIRIGHTPEKRPLDDDAATGETDAAKLERNVEAVFDLHAAAIDRLEDYTGIDYPFEKLDFALIPAFQYNGMEHAGCDLLPRPQPAARPKRRRTWTCSGALA